jgi:signal transduction histidine kinase
MDPSNRESPAAVSPLGRLRAWCRRRSVATRYKVLVVIAAFCVVNAVRRNANSRLLWEEPDAWVEAIATTAVSGIFVTAAVVFAVMAAFDRLPRRGWPRAAAMIGVVGLSSAVGTLMLLWWETIVVELSDLTLAVAFPPSWLRYVLLGLLFAWAYTYYRDREQAREAMRQSELDRAELERRLMESRLLVLQAQIEPHFLFNTLAHVKRLYQTDRVSARPMLGNLRAYLAGALPQMREPIARLDREIALAEAYLGMQQTRMGRRLSYAVDVPAELAGARLPTMMVLTLVENAIKHGLSPQREGGSVQISARHDTGQIQIEVADTGRGFVASSGGGAGLANLRSRLAILYGPQATLNLRHNNPRGVAAVLTLPLDAETAGVSVA